MVPWNVYVALAYNPSQETVKEYDKEFERTRGTPATPTT
tara:strand:+ start:456 stop:572 length:117 start_codon:yes stop_codon:yes gene_type:complete